MGTESNKNSTPLEKRKWLHRLYRRHEGESYQLALRLKVHRCNITKWFTGEFESSRIEQAILEHGAVLWQRELQARRIKRGLLRDQALSEHARAA